MERHRKDVDYYKSQLEDLRGDVRVLLDRQFQTDKLLKRLTSERQSHRESQFETQGDAYDG